MIAHIVPETESKISGWVERLRDSKYMIFMVVKDRSGHIQVTIEKEKMPEIVKSLEGVIAGSVVNVYGVAHLSEYVKMGGIEMIPTKVEVVSYAEAMPITDKANIDQRLDYRWIDLRDDAKRFIFEVETVAEMAMREYCLQNQFIEIHTPKISAQSTEGGSEVFKTEYFGQTAYLTQSPQLYKQMAMASGFEKVFEIGPCFRAEQSFTSRHATEFMSFDVEMSYIDNHHDVMDMEEDMLKYVLKRVHDTYGDKIKEVFGVDVVVPTVAFPRLTFLEAMDILEKEYHYPKKDDFDPESEKLLCQYAMKHYGSEFVFITDFPFANRAFYTMQSENGNSKSYDLLWKDQEITSGAQREHRVQQLVENIASKGINPENMKGYVDFFRYGCPAHGGYAIGINRFVAKLLGLPNIKEATFIFRGPNRIMP